MKELHDVYEHFGPISTWYVDGHAAVTFEAKFTAEWVTVDTSEAAISYDGVIGSSWCTAHAGVKSPRPVIAYEDPKVKRARQKRHERRMKKLERDSRSFRK